MKLSLLTALVLLSAVCRAKVVNIAPGVFYENCGPPFNVTIHPNPLRMRHTLDITVEFVAAHDMVAGVVEMYMDYWPYHYKDVYCADGHFHDPKGCSMSKGEKRVISAKEWIDDGFKQGHSSANLTLHNEDGELMLCARGSASMIFTS